jgi:hypothetical protein
MSSYLMILFGVVILIESLTRRIFLNTSEAGDSATEGFLPRWYHRVAFAALGVFLIGWGVHGLWKAH